MLRGILPFGKHYYFGQASKRIVDSHADLRWGPDIHANGACLTGLWQITEESREREIRGSCAISPRDWESFVSRRKCFGPRPFQMETTMALPACNLANRAYTFAFVGPNVFFSRLKNAPDFRGATNGDSE
ncbi:MAG: hypothetical protein ACREC4_06280 [Methylocella sp.]